YLITNERRPFITYHIPNATCHVTQLEYHSPGFQDVLGIGSAIQALTTFFIEIITLRHTWKKGDKEIEALGLSNKQKELESQKLEVEIAQMRAAGNVKEEELRSKQLDNEMKRADLE